MCNLCKMIPLILKLKKANQREIAKAQDIIVKTLFEIFNYAVMHGGTAIWRCYQGNRFSEDIDVYINKDTKKLNLLLGELEKKGFQTKKKKISENSVYFSFEFNRITVKFDAIFKKISGVLKDYETVDGNFATIYTLTPEEFLREKVSAYLNRFRIRDLYDIFFMLKHIKNIGLVKKELEKLIKEFKEPIDEKNLKVMILDWLAPDKEKMLEYIKDVVKNG